MSRDIETCLKDLAGIKAMLEERMRGPMHDFDGIFMPVGPPMIVDYERPDGAHIPLMTPEQCDHEVLILDIFKVKLIKRLIQE